MSWLRSPTVKLWLLCGVHAFLCVGSIALAAAVRSEVDPTGLVLPVALIQWALLIHVFGLFHIQVCLRAVLSREVLPVKINHSV